MKSQPPLEIREYKVVGIAIIDYHPEDFMEEIKPFSPPTQKGILENFHRMRDITGDHLLVEDSTKPRNNLFLKKITDYGTIREYSDKLPEIMGVVDPDGGIPYIETLQRDRAHAHVEEGGGMLPVGRVLRYL